MGTRWLPNELEDANEGHLHSAKQDYIYYELKGYAECNTISHKKEKRNKKSDRTMKLKTGLETPMPKRNKLPWHQFCLVGFSSF